MAAQIGHSPPLSSLYQFVNGMETSPAGFHPVTRDALMLKIQCKYRVRGLKYVFLSFITQVSEY
jgi:hypothetical protein